MTDPSAQAVTFRARGHSAIRATHGKTVEFSAERDVTGRATCVLGVAADLPAELEGLRGPVTVTLRAGGCEDAISAVANPRFAPGQRAVLRRSDYRSAETLATGADKAASDLDRDLVAALGDPGAELVVEVAAAAVPSLATAELLVVRAALADVGKEAARELSAAALLIDAGGGRGTWAAAAPGDGATRAAARLGEVPVAEGGEALGRGWEALERGQAVAVIGDPDADAQAAELVRAAAEAGVPVRAVAEPDRRVAALLAAGLTAGECAFLGLPPTRRETRGRQLAALAALGIPAVWEGRAEQLAPLLAEVAALWPGCAAGLTVAAGAPDETVRRGSAGELAAEAPSPAAGRRRGVLVVEVPPAAEAGSELEGEIRPLLAALLREGVTTRTLAAGLQALPGMSRRRAYDLALGAKGEVEG